MKHFTVGSFRFFCWFGSIFLTLFFFSSIVNAQYPVPTNAPTNFPAWWFARGVILPTNPTNSSPKWPSNYPASDDYSAINHGALKNMALAAYAEMQNLLPASVMSQSNGATLQSIITGWTNGTATNADNYAAVNLGQLKALAARFYNVLGDGSYTYVSGYPSNWTSGTYPWSTNTNAADAYSVANIGQAKYLFSFRLTNSANVIPAWWMFYYGFSGSQNAQSPSGDGYTLLQEFQLHRNPYDFYNGSTATLTIYSGNNQTAATNTYLKNPLIVSVTDSNGNPFTNAPVVFQSSAGNLVYNGSTNTTLQLKADFNGRVSIIAQMPNPSTAFTVAANATNSTNQVVFNVLQPQVPEAISNLKVWFRADQGIITNSSGLVSSWKDQSTNAYSVTQTNTNNQPLLVTNAFNGLPVVRFSGTSGLTNSTMPWITNTFNVDCTIIAVCASTNYSTTEYSICLGGLGGGVWQRSALGYSQTNQFFDVAYLYANGTNAMNSGAFSVEGYKAPDFFRNGLQTSFAYLSNSINTNGVPVRPTNTVNTNGLYIGQGFSEQLTPVYGIVATNAPPGTQAPLLYYSGGSTPSGWWQGDIAEILVYNRALNNTEWNNVSIYLAAKYSLTCSVYAPVISPSNNSSNPVSLSVSMTGATSPAVIYYTMNGSTPSTNSLVYTNPIILTQSAPIQAAIFLNGSMISPVASSQYYVADTGNTGISDAWWNTYFPTTQKSTATINALSPGGSGLTNLQAYIWGYIPTLYSSNGDGLSDYINHLLGFAGNNFDINGDGLSNAQDLALGLNPFFPNPNYTTAPPPNPGDHTVPSITLTQPIGATLLP